MDTKIYGSLTDEGLTAAIPDSLFSFYWGQEDPGEALLLRLVEYLDREGYLVEEAEVFFKCEFVPGIRVWQVILGSPALSRALWVTKAVKGCTLSHLLTQALGGQYAR